MPGLLRGVARVAVATNVSNRVSRRQGQRWAEQDAAAYEEQAPPAQQAVAAPAPAAPDPIERLKELGQLHEQGVLTDEEFAAQKAKLLG